MTDALARARADLEAGRAWQARDRLASFLVHRQDDEVLELLAQVHLVMGDLPKAGALLYVLRRGQVEDEVEQAAVDAWRRRFGNAEARWRAIPSPVRYRRSDELDALRAAVVDDSAPRDLPPPGPVPPSREAAELAGCAAWALALATLLALVVIGAVAVVRWVL